MNSKKNTKFSKFPIIMGIIWGCITAVTIGVIISIFNYNDSYHRSADSVSDLIISEDYGRFYSTIRLNLEDGLSTDEHPEFYELVAVARYIEAAGQYNLYLKNNQPDKADYYYNKMQEAINAMGPLRFTPDKIDPVFQLNQ